MKKNQKIKMCAAALLSVSLAATVWAGQTSPSNSSQNGILLAQGNSASQDQNTEQTGTRSDRSNLGRNDRYNNGNNSYNNDNNDNNGSDNSVSTRPQKVNKASELIGMEVRNQQGKELGDIKDIVVDLNSGKVSYLVMSSGGTLGFNQKDLAIPPSAFSCGTNQDQLILQASSQNVKQAQDIGDNWPSVQNPSFGAQPFWQENSNQQNDYSTNNWNNRADNNHYNRNHQYNQQQNNSMNNGDTGSTNKW